MTSWLLTLATALALSFAGFWARAADTRVEKFEENVAAKVDGATKKVAELTTAVEDVGDTLDGLTHWRAGVDASRFTAADATTEFARVWTEINRIKALPNNPPQWFLDSHKELREDVRTLTRTVTALSNAVARLEERKGE